MGSARRAAAPLRAAFVLELGSPPVDRFDLLMRRQESATLHPQPHPCAASDCISRSLRLYARTASGRICASPQSISPRHFRP